MILSTTEFFTQTISIGFFPLIWRFRDTGQEPPPTEIVAMLRPLDSFASNVLYRYVKIIDREYPVTSGIFQEVYDFNICDLPELDG